MVAALAVKVHDAEGESSNGGQWKILGSLMETSSSNCSHNRANGRQEVSGRLSKKSLLSLCVCHKALHILQ